MAARPRKSIKMFPLDPVKPSKPTAGLPKATTLQPVAEVKGSKAIPGFQAAPGRPATNIGQYLIKPTIEDKSGYEMLNTEPLSVTQAQENYLKKYELPPSLQPKYLRKPEVMENQRITAISKGFVKPRSRIQ